MDYLKIKEELKEIVATAESVPEKFKEKCFEILLNGFLAGCSGGKQHQIPSSAYDKLKEDSGESIPITASVRVFMKKTGITEDELKKAILYADDDVHFIKEPKTTNSALGQVQWALLLALKNAILKNTFSVDAESVRSVCQDKGFYSQAHFARNFKQGKNASFFKGDLAPQGEATTLTDEGYAELAKFIRGPQAD